MSKILRVFIGVLFFFSSIILIYGRYPILDQRIHGGPLCIESVLVKHYCANDFFAISEFFTGRENTGGDTILRTDDLQRAGLYLVVNLNKPVCELAEDAELVFQYVVSDCKNIKKKGFELKPKAGSSPWLFVGVTGADYHGRDQSFLAWSLEIYSNGERVSQESYLWEMDKVDSELQCNETNEG